MFDGGSPPAAADPDRVEGEAGGDDGGAAVPASAAYTAPGIELKSPADEDGAAVPAGEPPPGAGTASAAYTAPGIELKSPADEDRVEGEAGGDDGGLAASTAPAGGATAAAGTTSAIGTTAASVAASALAIPTRNPNTDDGGAAAPAGDPPAPGAAPRAAGDAVGDHPAEDPEATAKGRASKAAEHEGGDGAGRRGDGPGGSGGDGPAVGGGDAARAPGHVAGRGEDTSEGGDAAAGEDPTPTSTDRRNIPGANRLTPGGAAGAPAGGDPPAENAVNNAAPSDVVDEQHHVPDATLVVEQEVYQGTPLEPPVSWWAQGRTRLVLGVAGAALLVLSIVVVESRSSTDGAVPGGGFVRETSPPTTSVVPSSSPTLFIRETSPPSTSRVPSGPPVPSSCIPASTSGSLFDVDCVDSLPLIDMHGDTAVVTRDKIDIRFYSTTNSSLELVTRVDIDFVVAAVFVKGNTTVVGSYDEADGMVYIYEKDQGGSWSEALRITPDELGTVYFGWVLATDGDVILLGSLNTIYVYRRNQTTWVQEAVLSPPDGYDVEGFSTMKVQGNSIVAASSAYQNDMGILFEYGLDPASNNSWTPVGVPLVNEDCPAKFGAVLDFMDDGHLMVLCQRSFYAMNPAVLSYYKKEEMHNAFVLQQSLGFDRPVWSEDVDGDAMVLTEFLPLSQQFMARFFARQNNTWEEVTTVNELPGLPGRGYGWRVRMSGNTVLFASYVNAYPFDRVEMGW